VKLPGQYAKFITAALGQVLVYLQIYGWAWHIKPAAVMAAIALGVLAVPNTPKAPAAVLPTVPATGNVTTIPPAT
jgi:hypothetical protein